MSEKRILAMTAKGKAELTGASTSLSPSELELLVLVDGIATVDDIARHAEKKLGVANAATMLEKLEKAGYVADAGAAASISAGSFLQESETGLASLQATGYFVRIARHAPEHPAPAKGQKITVLVVEDDAALAKLLRTYLQMEDFAVRTAGTREGISKALSEPPKPDVVLLDVMLPDIDGFDVLAKMRQHELLKNVPVIMTTAKATRENVLTGLQRGADGYITKPYDMQVLVQAVKTVLGLESGPARAWEGPV